MKIDKKNLWKEKIPYIKELEEFFSKISYKGINLWPIMANEVYTYYKNQDRGFFERALLITRYIFFKDNLKVERSNKKILASYFMRREDHHELTQKALDSFSKKELFFLDGYESKKKPFSSYSFYFPNIFLLFKIWRKFRKAKLERVLGRYYYLLLARTYQRHKQIGYFLEIVNKLSPQAYIAFCSAAFGEEAILTLLCKKRNIPTFTLQHSPFHKSSDPFSPAIIQNENAISDYHLIWGENSKNPLKGYLDLSNLIIVGNPKYKMNKIKRKQRFNPKKATVFFSVPGYDEGNIQLLKIVKEFIKNHPEVKFNISVHPMDDIKNYSNNLQFKNIKIISKEVLAQTLLEESDFIILYNTGVTVEALNYKIPIFRYAGKDFRDFWDYDDRFGNLKELEKLFSKIKNKKAYIKLINFYNKELKKTFYLHPKKETSNIYYEKIMKTIKEWYKK